MHGVRWSRRPWSGSRWSARIRSVSHGGPHFWRSPKLPSACWARQKRNQSTQLRPLGAAHISQRRGPGSSFSCQWVLLFGCLISYRRVCSLSGSVKIVFMIFMHSLKILALRLTLNEPKSSPVRTTGRMGVARLATCTTTCCAKGWDTMGQRDTKRLQRDQKATIALNCSGRPRRPQTTTQDLEWCGTFQFPSSSSAAVTMISLSDHPSRLSCRSASPSCSKSSQLRAHPKTRWDWFALGLLWGKCPHQTCDKRKGLSLQFPCRLPKQFWIYCQAKPMQHFSMFIDIQPSADHAGCVKSLYLLGWGKSSHYASRERGLALICLHYFRNIFCFVPLSVA